MEAPEHREAAIDGAKCIMGEVALQFEGAEKQMDLAREANAKLKLAGASMSGSAH